MSPGGRKNVVLSLTVSAASMIILRAPPPGAARVIPWSPAVPVQGTHTCVQRTGCSSASPPGQPAGESPFLDTDALFQEQALTSACDRLVGLSS